MVCVESFKQAPFFKITCNLKSALPPQQHLRVPQMSSAAQTGAVYQHTGTVMAALTVQMGRMNPPPAVS